jgi:toxin-antitoxin system PIN domain toxin
MIMPDVNILLYAHDTTSPNHERARSWWEEQLNGSQMIAMAWVALLGFIRLTTNPRVCGRPYPPSKVMEIVGAWLQKPQVKIIHPSDRHFEILSKFIRHLGTAGNLTTDAHLAALAVERGLILQTTDSDFARFPGLKWRNPLA